MINYAVKRCESFGFASSVEKALSLFPQVPKDIVYIDDEHPIPSPEEYEGQTKTFFVILGKEEVVDTQELKPCEDDLDYLYDVLRTDKEHIEEINSCIELYKNRAHLDGKGLKRDFCDFLLKLYPHLKDSKYKHVIYKTLRDEHVDEIEELVKKYPFEYETVSTHVMLNTKPFEDVNILIDKTDSGASSNIYKNKEDSQKVFAGDSVYLEAISNGIFTVVRGKRSAGFTYENRLMNHDTLDLVIRNGIVCTPKSMDDGSFGNLMKVFEKCKSFTVVFIHPSLISKSILVEHPCEPALPEYTIGSGEILAIAFRYMCMNFFGYKGVYDASLKEYEYLF